MRQRKLLLEPFHGKNVKRWEATIRSITEQDIARWPLGEAFSLHDHTRTITLEVILRAVFGVREQDRFERARALVKEFANRAHPISMFPLARRDLGPLSPWVRFKRSREALDGFLYEEIERRRAEADLAERHDVLSLLLCATDEAGEPLSRAGASRRAGDGARGRPRDHRDGGGLGVRAAAADAAGTRPPHPVAGRGRRVPRGHDQGDAPHAPGRDRRRAQADERDRTRWLSHPRRARC